MAQNDVKYTLRCGFFNGSWIGEGEAPAVEYDRVYDSSDMMEPYSNVVTDGIFAYESNVGGGDGELEVGFACSPHDSEANTVTLGVGKGIINGHWFNLDHSQNIEVAQNSSLTTRVDSIIVQCNTQMLDRAVYLIYRQGTATHPALETNDSTIFEFRLWDINVPSNQLEGSISVTDMRGTDECPYITGLLQQLSLDERLNKFDEDVENKLNQYDQDLQDKLDSYDSQFNEKIDGYTEQVNTLIQNTNTTITNKIQEFENEADEKMAGYDSTFNSKVSGYDSTFEGKISSYDSQIQQKIQSYDASMTQIWAEWNAIKQEIEETGGTGGGGVSTTISIATQHLEYTSGTVQVADYDVATDTVFVFINGLYANTTEDYTLAGGIITFKNTINSGAVIDIWKFRVVTVTVGTEDPVQGFSIVLKDTAGEAVSVNADGTYHIESGNSYFVEAPLYTGTYSWEQYDGSQWQAIAEQSSTTLTFSAGQYSKLRCVIHFEQTDYISTELSFTVEGGTIQQVATPVITIE